ncbi:hypothetical protein [Mycolicibacter heraklionensis]|uniref:hypothetical protein n=1 Tax=Mycolicibacter heraklionensis TaxID=512402 RepID=UPI00103DF5F5|nr:hypothetical protein [Mycolicibacter heraklionensis]
MSSQQVAAARREIVVRLTLDGHSRAVIAEKAGITSARVSQIRRASGVYPPSLTMQERFDAFDDALANGMTPRQALDDAGWSNRDSAMRAYQRAGRATPDVLRRDRA